MRLRWEKVGRHAYIAEDGHGGHYQVDRLLFAWHAVHTAKRQVRAIEWPPGVKHNLENGMAACQEDEEGERVP